MNKTVYHGSNYIIEKPELKYGRRSNDFGRGFYCTEDYELACEWACQKKRSGYANTYELDMDGLRVLDLIDGNYSVLNWIALLLKNRNISLSNPTLEQSSEYVIKNFAIDTEGYDVIIGYRADDSYFSYARSWLSNSLPLNELHKALYLGELGEQIVLVSDKAFDNLSYVRACPVMCEEYYPRYVARDEKARADFRKILNRRNYNISFNKSDIYVMDIMREEMTADDARLQRFVCRRRDM